MKKPNTKFLIIFILLIVAAVFSFILYPKPFKLEDKYYQTSTYLDLDKTKLNQLIEDQESFLVFICQDLCVSSNEFNQVLDNFLAKHRLTIYKLYYSEMKDTVLGEHIKYYPSFAVVKKGQVIASLDANSDAHTEIYQDVNEFEKWLSKYVILSGAPGSSQVTSPQSTTEPAADLSAKLSHLKYDNHKVNIYFFWGRGCPKCDQELAFFNQIKAEYGQYYTLNSFEVWHDATNSQIFRDFAKTMGNDAKAVPYTIIGRKTFIGFSEKYAEDIKNAIISQHQNSYDVHFNQKP